MYISAYSFFLTLALRVQSATQETGQSEVSQVGTTSKNCPFAALKMSLVGVRVCTAGMYFFYLQSFFVIALSHTHTYAHTHTHKHTVHPITWVD